MSKIIQQFRAVVKEIVLFGLHVAGDE